MVPLRGMHSPNMCWALGGCSLGSFPTGSLGLEQVPGQGKAHGVKSPVELHLCWPS